MHFLAMLDVKHYWLGNILLALETHGNLVGNPGQFDESSNYIMGWLRDYLWLNSSPLINGYPFGMNNLSVWTWMFLFGHLFGQQVSCS
jgi:hypothetical protein